MTTETGHPKAKEAPGRRRGPRLWSLLLLAAAALYAAYGQRAWLLQRVGYAFVRDDAPAHGDDDIYLLMGDSSPVRADAALGAYRAGVGRRIVLASVALGGFERIGVAREQAHVHEAYLLARGVPRDNVVLIQDCGNDSTLDEARCFARHLAADAATGGRPRPDRIVVVTSWYHTSRAGWLFERVLGPMGVRVEMLPASDPESSPMSWWRHETSFLAVFNETLKWAYWLSGAPARSESSR